MSKIQKLLILTLVLVFGAALFLAAPAAKATLTIDATSMTSNGAVTIDGVAASTYAIATSTTTGTITIGGLAQTGNIDIASSTGNLTLDLGTGITGVKTIHIGDSATANVITIGSTNGAASLALQVGTGNFSLNGVAASTYAIGASTTGGTITIGGTAQTGNIDIASSTGTLTLDLATGITGVKTINIGTGNVANKITIGSTSTTAGTGVKINGVSTVFHPTTAVSFSAETTSTASQLLNAGIFLHPDNDTANRNLGFPTTASIALAMPGGAVAAGDTFSFLVANGVYVVTLVAGDASTTITEGLTKIASSTTRVVYCQFTNGVALAMTCY